ncbi:MAG TPA: hypothetical protein VIJ96_16610 [Acidothermaceae bacterium]
MTRQHRLDTYVARLARMSDEQTASLAGLPGHEALLEEISHMPRIESGASIEPIAARRRRHVPLVVGAVATVLIGGTAAGWALAPSSSHNTVSIDCVITGTGTVIPSESGNAVSDCAAQWRSETGRQAPPLAAYDNGHGGIAVAPADQTPAPAFTRIPAATSQNVAVIDLQESLDDYVQGLNSGCYDNRAATTMARHDLTALGLSGWTVVPATPGSVGANPELPQPVASPFTSTAATPAPSSSGSTRQCVDTSILDSKAQTITLRYSEVPGNVGTPYQQLAVKLRKIARSCQPLNATESQVRAATNSLALSEAAHDYKLTKVAQTDVSCTVIHETVGGMIFLTLRGPTS